MDPIHIGESKCERVSGDALGVVVKGSATSVIRERPDPRNFNCHPRPDHHRHFAKDKGPTWNAYDYPCLSDHHHSISPEIPTAKRLDSLAPPRADFAKCGHPRRPDDMGRAGTFGEAVIANTAVRLGH
jgi:hypothetical protein